MFTEVAWEMGEGGAQAPPLQHSFSSLLLQVLGKGVC